MKNNTKIRLHLSKTLFENIVKEVVSESKKMNMSGGAYTESVKMPKKAKKMEEVNAVADTDKMKKMEEVDAVRDTESMRKMHEMSSKEKMAKGLYKEVDALEDLKQYKTGMKLQKKGKPDETFTIQMVQPGRVKGMEAAHALHLKNDKTGQEFTDSPGYYEVVESMNEDAGTLQPGDNITWLDGHQREYKGVIQSQEGGDYYKAKITAAPAGGHKVGDILTKQSGDVKKAMGEMQINVAEKNKMNEFTGTETESSGAIAMLAAALGMGIPLAAALIKDLMRAKSPEEKKQVIQKELPGKEGGDVAPKEAFGPQNESKKKVMPKLNELRKQIKNK